MNFQTILKISRPRFWSYLAGPFAVGFVAGANSLTDFLGLQPFVFLLFFLFPANLFLYGVNDWFDQETDALNQKKTTQEHRLQQQQRSTLLRWLVAAVVLAALLLSLLPLPSMLWLALFLFLSYSYSAPPIRFKSRPFLDSYSNVLYAIPGFMAYNLVSGEQVPWLIFFAAWTWTAGMHAFSALPDIIPDKKAGITTVATTLGTKKTLIFVGLNWLFTAAVATSLGGWIFSFALLYPLLCGVLLLTRKVKIDTAYWYFPWLNTIFGTLLFWYFGLSLLV